MLKKAALISVSDRTGLEHFDKILRDCGYVLLTTSGSGKFLTSVGIESLSIENYTRQNEILDGRVKTLHPKIHAGLLAKRQDEKHMKELETNEILPIDIAVVNLYPFVQGLESEHASHPTKMVELIDIGGPTMIRAAAKNFSGVIPLIDPEDYEEVGELLVNAGKNASAADAVPLSLRQKLSVKVFAALAQYNLEIARYFSGADVQNDQPPERGASAPIEGFVLNRAQILRYGENPHQGGAYYHSADGEGDIWKQFQGKELSYNNFLDFDAAVRLISVFGSSAPTAAILKHLNPCGVATANSLVEAIKLAKLGDPRSHFGGVLAFNCEVDQDAAEAVAEDFAEIVVAPAFSAQALDIFSRKKNLRVLQADFKSLPNREVRSVFGGILLQERDPGASSAKHASVVSKRKPTSQELSDLDFAWKICAHVKSNAITIAKNGMLQASGAGQMSRIDSVETALRKCLTHSHDTKSAVAASDAFFPFPDCVEAFAAAGISAIIAPRGAKRDADTIAAADKLNVALLFTEDRHFRH